MKKHLWKRIKRWRRLNINDLHSKSYNWIHRRFIPTLIEAGRTPTLSKKRCQALADVYYLLGDIHHFNDAPQAASACYLRSALLSPSSWALRELGGMLDQHGLTFLAEAVMRQGVAYGPDDEYLQSDLSHLILQPVSQPLARIDDPLLVAREWLARGEPQQALALLSQEPESVILCQHRAMAFGALGDEAAYLDQWQRIAGMDEPLEMTFGDYFFLPDAVDRDPRFWAILVHTFPRMKNGVFPVDETLLVAKDPQPPVDDGTPYRFPDKPDAKMLAILSFIQYRLGGDLAGLRDLHARYPNWKNLEKEIARLEKKRYPGAVIAAC